MAEKPPQLQENPIVPPGTTPLIFDKFTTLNTKASRNGIKDEEMFWCDGFMPLGPNNLRTLPDIGAPIYTATGGKTVVWYNFGNLSFTPYCIVLLSDGSIIAVNTNTFAVSTVLAAGSVTSPSIFNIGMTQWGQQYIIIVVGQNNGFYIWDGANTFKQGTVGPDVTLYSGGAGYSSQPTITALGGSGTGATFTASFANGYITGVTTTNPGTGYLSSDQIILDFTGGGSAGTSAVLKPLVAGGTVTSVSIVSGGRGYSTPSGTVLDSTGIGAAISLVATGGSITSVSISTGGAGYSSNPVVLVQDPNSPVAVATVDVMPTGVEGTSAETYSSRLFVSESALIQISAPGSLVDFSAANGGDEFTSTDSFLRASFVKLQQSNGFIYLVADSSVNYISNIQTGGSPLLTQFSNQNADPEVGSPWSTTSGVFGENIILANPSGVYVGYGGRFIKISDALDGIFSTVPGTPSIISAAKAIIFGRKVWMLLGQILNPITNTAQNKLMMTDGKAWWTSSQSVTLTFVASQEINSVLTAFGTDGTSIYPLFQTPSTNFVKTVQSRFWDEPGGYLTGKTADRLWGAVNYYNTASPALTISVDTEKGSQSYTVNTSIAAIGVSVLPVFAVAQEGTLMGMTLSTSCADVALISLQLGVQAYSYRG